MLLGKNFSCENLVVNTLMTLDYTDWFMGDAYHEQALWWRVAHRAFPRWQVDFNEWDALIRVIFSRRRKTLRAQFKKLTLGWSFSVSKHPKDGSSIPNMDPSIPNMDPSIPNMDPSIPNMDPSIPNMDPSIPNMDPSIPNMDPSIPNIDPSIPNMDPSIPNMDPSIFNKAPHIFCFWHFVGWILLAK